MLQSSPQPSSSIFDFEIKKFSIISLSTVLLAVYSFYFGLFGIAFIVYPLSLVIIFKPKVLISLKLEKVSQIALKFSGKWIKQLSFLPGVRLRGKWILDPISDTKRVDNIGYLLLFLLKRFTEIIFVGFGFQSFVLRIWWMLKGSPEEGPIIYAWTHISIGFIYLSTTIAIIGLIFYISWVWVWEDSGLKIVREQRQNLGIKKIWPAASSIRALFGYFAGLGSWLWFFNPKWINQLNEFFSVSVTGEETGLISDTVTSYLLENGLAIFLMGFLIILFSAPLLLVSVFYYISGVHEHFVNSLRYTIYNQSLSGKIGDVQSCNLCNGTGKTPEIESQIIEPGISIGNISLVPVSPYALNLLKIQKSTEKEAPSVLRFCQTCGLENLKQTKYCTSCGKNMEVNK